MEYITGIIKRITASTASPTIGPSTTPVANPTTTATAPSTDLKKAQLESRIRAVVKHTIDSLLLTPGQLTIIRSHFSAPKGTTVDISSIKTVKLTGFQWYCLWKEAHPTGSIGDPDGWERVPRKDGTWEFTTDNIVLSEFNNCMALCSAPRGPYRIECDYWMWEDVEQKIADDDSFAPLPPAAVPAPTGVVVRTTRISQLED